MAGGEGSAQKMAIAQRRALAVELRKQGGSYRAIAQQLSALDGVSDDDDHTQAYKDVMAELKRIREQSAEDAASVRELELQRLDELFVGMFARAKQGDYAAFDRVLTLMNQRAKYLPVFPVVEQKIEINQDVTTHGDLTTDPAAIYRALAFALGEGAASDSGAGQANADPPAVDSVAGSADASVPDKS
jgi:hypothetical protein